MTTTGIPNIYHYMDTIGNGRGDIDFIDNYSVTPTKARHNVPANEHHELHRLIISIEDSSGMKADEYGDLGAALTNGITIVAEDDNSTLLNITDNVPIKTNAQWGQLCFDTELKSWGGTPSDDILLVRFTFEKSGLPIVIHGHPKNNRRLVINLSDDFSGLIHHKFMLQGIKRIT